MIKTWKPRTGKYQSGEALFLGRVSVGIAHYSPRLSKGDPPSYECECNLPGIKQSTEKYPTIEQAKARLERQIDAWFAWVNEEAKEC